MDDYMQMKNLFDKAMAVEETEEKYFRGSYLRQGEPKDRSAVRGKKLADFLVTSETEGGEQKMKTKLKAAYACVGKGWHGLLDKYLPQILDIDPDCELIVKEKYGALRIQPYKVSEGVSRNKINAIVNKAEKESEKVCEICGAPGYPHLDGFWLVTLCDSCAKREGAKQ